MEIEIIRKFINKIKTENKQEFINKTTEFIKKEAYNPEKPEHLQGHIYWRKLYNFLDNLEKDDI